MQDLFGGGGSASSDEVADVPVDHLDYGYVEKCDSSKELLAILAYLRSGKEGRYEHLEKTVEARLLTVLPPAERAKYIAMTHEPTRDEAREAAADVQGWLGRIRAVDAQAKAKSAPATATIPPPRGSAAAAAAPTTRAAREAIEDAPPVPTPAALLSPVELDAAAERERLKGNECFREGDFSRAAQYYSRSLEFRPAAPLVLCNRAQARIRLKQYDFAVEDCDAALKADGTLVKAWVRRATARMALGRFAEAVPDLETAARLDGERGGGAAASEIAKLLGEARTKAASKEAPSPSALPAPVQAPAPAPAPAPVPAPAPAPASRGRRLKIVEEDDDEAPAAPDAVMAAPAAAAPPAVEPALPSPPPQTEAATPAAAPAAVEAAATQPRCDPAATPAAPPAAAPPSPLSAPPTVAAPAPAAAAPAPASSPQAWDTHKAAGNAAFQQGRMQDALASYRLALEAAGGEAGVHAGRAAVRCNVALVLLREKDLAGAVAACSAALSGDLGLSAATLDAWASAHEAGGDPPEVADDLGALAVKALFRRATALVELGASPERSASAARDLRAALALDPSNEKVRLLLKETVARAQPPSPQPRVPPASAASASAAAGGAAAEPAVLSASPALGGSSGGTPPAPASAGRPVAAGVQPPLPPPAAAQLSAPAAPSPSALPATVSSPAAVTGAASPPPLRPTSKASASLAATAAATVAALSSASSPTLARSQPWQRAPATAIDFEKSCKALRGDATALHAYLRAHVDGALLPALFSRRALEPDTLTAIINALHSGVKAAAAAAGESDALRHAAALLGSISRTRDAETVLMMASGGDRQKLRETLAAIDKAPGERVSGLESLKAALES